ncbi:MAG: hypothetical protein GEV07_30525 [Streptosporangiales bacterium]|nr:hypothetical protein [Streptosporangiales bacterium]
MFHRHQHKHCDCGWRYQLYKQPPAEIIRRISALAQLPLSSRGYRRLMTNVDAALFSRPDYPELIHLATAIKRDLGGHQ